MFGLEVGTPRALSNLESQAGPAFGGRACGNLPKDKETHRGVSFPNDRASSELMEIRGCTHMKDFW
ncbi:hypothetical protein MJO28_006704 [Puccinia striiformis f. sp. tritici]|uniref:Uncharacterized protein n=1 Tax=Puccinia striiformis f. sp. tritici TaxID=168172 RepID=A0ACC0EJX4_9BASI|nr:hypothetical protein MJO28_006704 [Puccinia striiformis f. sp. tritici]KAI7958462.1 hypothetical protein MJO29_006679 [Puccinia striiformis f. sp. tritici]